jgi:endo-1,3-1,4-beta-glycanase ExoK
VKHLFLAGLISLGVLLSLAASASAAKPQGAVAWADELLFYDTARWSKADGWSNGLPFNVGWRADHVTFADDLMTLRLDNTPCSTGCSGEPYASGEYRTVATYGYGRYEVRMKPAKGSGLVSSFFTFNGPSERPRRPWDEIDIEILGKDTTKLQTNYFTSGVGGHETTIDLGFDASLAFHTYAFEWSSTRIAWYVDGVLRHGEHGTRGPLPTTPGKVMMNLWTGEGVDAWMGAFQYTGPVFALYDSVSFTPEESAPPPTQGPVVHVGSNSLVVLKSGSRYQGLASVRIVDAAGVGVAGVTVEGGWSGATTTGNTAVTTDVNGLALFYSSRSTATGPFTFCVSKVSGSGVRYDPTLNTSTCSTASFS